LRECLTSGNVISYYTCSVIKPRALASGFIYELTKEIGYE